ncbi:uncharacterized mitochondrial protein AtMg00820-like [Rutidosis leptorrhynchoides]|uniref:uncharacterized mitochondrial protein AtMg00820-like n=1 Tax=Rutidosis leptorrhynchoides TaxID=125765 RepID=UPI003A98CEC8
MAYSIPSVSKPSGPTGCSEVQQIKQRSTGSKGSPFGAGFTDEVHPEEALKDHSWGGAMQDELSQFERNRVWNLVPTHADVEKKIIGTKWVFKTKMDEDGVVIKNKARLVAHGFRQEEGFDYGETYAPVARMEEIRIFLAFATHMNFKVFQIMVKSTFLKGKLQEEVYLKKPPDFVCRDPSKSI